METQTLPETREVQIQANQDQISWADDIGEPSGDGPSENLRDHGLACPTEGQGCPVIPWVCELLPKVHSRIF